MGVDERSLQWGLEIVLLGGCRSWVQPSSCLWLCVASESVLFTALVKDADEMVSIGPSCNTDQGV